MQDLSFFYYNLLCSCKPRELRKVFFTVFCFYAYSNQYIIKTDVKSAVLGLWLAPFSSLDLSISVACLTI